MLLGERSERPTGRKAQRARRGPSRGKRRDALALGTAPAADGQQRREITAEPLRRSGSAGETRDGEEAGCRRPAPQIRDVYRPSHSERDIPHGENMTSKLGGVPHQHQRP